MYKVLIVDDKSLIRKGLIKSIQWENLGVELAGEAENGNKAVQIIKDNSIDIVITDVRMPETDGISLLKYIRENNPHIQTVVISGYDDFQYAQQAIKNGSLDYILKPVDDDELNASIRKACDILLKNSNLENIPDKEKRASENLYKLIHGMKVNKEDLEYLDKIGLNRNLFCVAAERGWNGTSGISDIYHKIKNNEGFDGLYLISDKKESLIIFCAVNTQDTGIFEAKIFNTLKSKISERDTRDEKSIIGIGKAFRGLDSLEECYDTAYEAMTYSLLDEENIIIKYSDISNKKMIKASLEKYENLLLISVTSGNIKEADSILDKIFDGVSREKDISIDSIRLIISDLCHILLRLDISLSNEISDFLKKINDSHYLLSFQSFKNIKQVLYNLFNFSTRKFIDEKGGKDSLIANVKNFIDKNYFNDVGLEEIARLFHISAPYLSKIFKQEMGVNISEYLTNIRIQKSIEILREGSIDTVKLAQMVGYSDYAYFYKVFKRVTGMTPREYLSKRT